MNTLTRENRDTDRVQTEQFVPPPASVIEAGDGYTLEIEMPGVTKDGLDISVENNELTIVGRRSLPQIEGTLIHDESAFPQFVEANAGLPFRRSRSYETVILRGLMCSALGRVNVTKPCSIFALMLSPSIDGSSSNVRRKLSGRGC